MLNTQSQNNAITRHMPRHAHSEKIIETITTDELYHNALKWVTVLLKQVCVPKWNHCSNNEMKQLVIPYNIEMSQNSRKMKNENNVPHTQTS